MATLSEIRATDVLSLTPEAVADERVSLHEQVEGDFTLRDEAAGLVQSVMKATHMLGQNHGIRLMEDPFAAMLGGAPAPGESDSEDLSVINQRLGFVGAHAADLDEMTPWALAYLVVDIVTVVFSELTEDLPTL